MANQPATVQYRGVMVQPDPFVKQFAGRTADATKFYVDAATMATYSPLDAAAKVLYGEASQVARTVARPAGIAIKPNTYATARVITSDGTRVRVLNDVGNPRTTRDVLGDTQDVPGGQTDEAWTDWILVSVHEERTEKTQIVETFGDTYVYAFGERPRVMSFSGALFNSTDFPWRAVFWENWDEYFRATKLIERDARMYITFDDVMVEGYPLTATADQFSQEPHMLNFRFSFLVTNYVNLSVSEGFKQARLQNGANAATVANRLNVNQVPFGYGQTANFAGASLQSRNLATAWLGQYGIDQLTNSLALSGDDANALFTSGYASLLAGNLKTMLSTLERAAYSGLGGQPLGKALSASILNASLSIAASQVAFFRQLGLTKLDDALGLQSGESQAAIGFGLEMAGRIALMVSGDAQHPHAAPLPSVGAQMTYAALGYGFWPTYESMNVQQGGQAAQPMLLPQMSWDPVAKSGKAAP